MLITATHKMELNLITLF